MRAYRLRGILLLPMAIKSRARFQIEGENRRIAFTLVAHQFSKRRFAAWRPIAACLTAQAIET
jgi:hypothetical protein